MAPLPSLLARVRGAPRRTGAALRAVWTADGRWPRLLLLAAFALIAALYACNRHKDYDPGAPRGDGVYRPVPAGG